MDHYRFRLGIVIPLANEEHTIDTLLNRILILTDGNDSIFCITDNASSEATRQKIKEYSIKHHRIHEVWAPENRSVVDAYFCGYKEAIAKDCKWILEMDGGMSHNPNEIPKFIKAMEQGYDFAAGSRFIENSNYSGISIRKIISRWGSILTNILLGTKMKDMTSGFECFSNKAMKHVLKQGVKSRAHFFQTEIRYNLRKWNYIEIPISYNNPSKRLASKNVFEALYILYQLFKKERLYYPK